MAARISIVLENDLVMINEIIANGANFCQVERIRHDSHEIEVITDGYHKWHGAIPIFSTRDIRSKNLIWFRGNELLNHKDRLDMSITLDPRA